MANKIDKTLLNTLSALAKKEKKGKEFSRRVRVKGKVVKKGLTNKGNIKLVVQKGEDKYGFVIIKSHKVNYALAEKLTDGSLVSAEGINKFRVIICTKLKQIYKVDETEQTTLQSIKNFQKVAMIENGQKKQRADKISKASP